MCIFQTQFPNIEGNDLLRAPQIEAYYALTESNAREVGLILPVGCGKSGCIALAPFAFKSKRTLVVAPGLNITNQLDADFDPSNANMFYRKCAVLTAPPYPEPVKIRGNTTNHSDLHEADVVISNIQQLQGGEDNRWLSQLPTDFFDLIIFDEAHHGVATSWIMLKEQFPNARIINYSATPLRADGQLMTGEVIYSYSIFRAIQAGYVKRLKAVQLNPKTLRYVRCEDEREVEVDLDEVRRLGEEDANFRRSIVTSNETLNTIVDASLKALADLRQESDNGRLKIIASALNHEHCIQIVEAYRARNQRADYVHSRIDSIANERVLKRLDNHDLDVIVQVRKLGEGFDHKYLAVAAVFSIFTNLSPFVQFVGRIMRVIRQNAPNDLINRGAVVFHAGANVARRWSDFQNYSEADQNYFDQLLPLEGLDPSDSREKQELEPISHQERTVEVKNQSEVELEEIPLIPEDEKAAIRLLQERGRIEGEIDLTGFIKLQPIPTTKVRERQAKRNAIDEKVKSRVGRILKERNISPGGYELGRKGDKKTNFVVLKAAIDKKINQSQNRGSGQRYDFSRAELDNIESEFDVIVKQACEEIFNGKD